MEAGRIIMAESVTKGFYDTFYEPAVKQDVCTYVALFYAYDHSGIKELAPLCERGVLGALEILTSEYPLSDLDKYGFHGWTQRLWQLGMSMLYKTNTMLRTQVAKYVEEVKDSKEISIMIPPAGMMMASSRWG